MDKLTHVNGYPVLAQRPAHAAGPDTFETVYVLCSLPDHPVTPFVNWEYGFEIGPCQGDYCETLEEALAVFHVRGNRPPVRLVGSYELELDTGPWQLTVEPLDPVSGQGGVFIHDDLATLAVCDASHRLTDAQILANARLMRAAPELYQALERLVTAAHARGAAEHLVAELADAEAALATVAEPREEED